ncbi:Ankyrin repeat and sterile alpha motif domain-containing protein 1B [Liparis tanakae]|uniref:Ankyrin repeat and sterile alpha motif domain-containing protein 1B n=1 Tax=Liparis tanakae TaxID=230148 RepID=A0A4Z2HB68_9TELE|nr:Ankyrin repeat and sterile alpha motif domain-containing protein 1B [Liparis tanakae]
MGKEQELLEASRTGNVALVEKLLSGKKGLLGSGSGSIPLPNLLSTSTSTSISTMVGGCSRDAVEARRTSKLQNRSAFILSPLRPGLSQVIIKSNAEASGWSNAFGDLSPPPGPGVSRSGLWWHPGRDT